MATEEEKAAAAEKEKKYVKESMKGLLWDVLDEYGPDSHQATLTTVDGSAKHDRIGDGEFVDDCFSAKDQPINDEMLEDFLDYVKENLGLNDDVIDILAWEIETNICPTKKHGMPRMTVDVLAGEMAEAYLNQDAFLKARRPEARIGPWLSSKARSLFAKPAP